MAVEYFCRVQRAHGPLRILVVGQTPPPFGGQAVMVAAFLEGEYDGIRLHHVRMAFSSDMDRVGRFEFRKILVLLWTIARVWSGRIRHRTTVLYYPPAGPNTVPVMRDIALLLSTRWMFRHTVFHFHAGGVSGFAPRLPALIRPFFHWAYRAPSLAIRTATQNPDDGAVFGALRNVVIPNGVPDESVEPTVAASGAESGVVILFTGVLIRSKGVMVLLEAFRSLCEKGLDVRLELMGRWGDPDFEQECANFLKTHGLSERVELLGVLLDEAKRSSFAGCDIFCFPSFFEAESFGLVLVEAMVHSKPVVSTYWRGIPSVVEDGRNGFLVPVEDPGALEQKLDQLVRNRDLRLRMGEQGRRIFEERFMLDGFHRSMERELLTLVDKN